MEEYNHDENLLARWLSDELTEEELANLQQREDYADLLAIVEGMKGLDAPAFSEQDAWEKLQQRLKAEPPKVTGEETAPTVISERDNEIIEAVANAVAIIDAAPAQVVSKRVLSNIEIPAKAAPSPTPPPIPKLTPVVETPVRSISRRQWLYAAAATVAILLATILFLPDHDPSHDYDNLASTGNGEQKKITLPDGSTAQLNAGSLIGFTETAWPDGREVYLRGEAYFKAKKGKTFTVLTDQGKVRVIGTMFNVFARGNELDVKCTEGTVQVLNPMESEKVLIKAGEQVSVLNSKMQKRRGIDFTPKWFNGESVFRSAPRQKVFGEIERQFGVKVFGDDLTNGSPFSGKFVNDDLGKALKMVGVPMGLKYEMRNDTVWFSPK